MRKEREECLASVIPNMSDEKQSYLLGFGEGMAVMQKKEAEENDALEDPEDGR